MMTELKLRHHTCDNCGAQFPQTRDVCDICGGAPRLSDNPHNETRKLYQHRDRLPLALRRMSQQDRWDMARMRERLEALAKEAKRVR